MKLDSLRRLCVIVQKTGVRMSLGAAVLVSSGFVQHACAPAPGGGLAAADQWLVSGTAPREARAPQAPADAASTRAAAVYASSTRR
jgi:hypothetical protein